VEKWFVTSFITDSEAHEKGGSIFTRRFVAAEAGQSGEKGARTGDSSL